jgi:penicillin G amidase
MGDTIRSWRLRERLGQHAGKFTPADVLAVHYDTVNPARREIVRLGLHFLKTRPEALSEAARKALQVLEPWLLAGASSDLNARGAELATGISTFFRMMVTPVALKYGGGESGLARFLKDAAARVQADPQARFTEDEAQFIDSVLANAWRQPEDRGARDARSARRGNPPGGGRLGWFDSLDGFGSLDPNQDLAQPGITCLDGQTLHCQSAQSYTQWVSLDDADAAQTICPIGHSDRPESRYRTNTLALWAAGKLHPAPLSRQAVEKIAAEHKLLGDQGADGLRLLEPIRKGPDTAP